MQTAAEATIIVSPNYTFFFFFFSDFFVLPLNGAEVVLGVHWLGLLGSVLADYKKLTIDFHWKGQ